MNDSIVSNSTRKSGRMNAQKTVRKLKVAASRLAAETAEKNTGNSPNPSDSPRTKILANGEENKKKIRRSEEEKLGKSLEKCARDAGPKFVGLTMVGKRSGHLRG